MYKRIKTRSDTTLLVGVLKNYFPNHLENKIGEALVPGSLKFFKTLLNVL